MCLLFRHATTVFPKNEGSILSFYDAREKESKKSPEISTFIVAGVHPSPSHIHAIYSFPACAKNDFKPVRVM